MADTKRRIKNEEIKKATTEPKAVSQSTAMQERMESVSRKILITSQIQKENHFIDDLLLSKEDIQQIKKYNLFTLGE